jgi:hypothetical protein
VDSAGRIQIRIKIRIRKRIREQGEFAALGIGAKTADKEGHTAVQAFQANSLKPA